MKMNDERHSLLSEGQDVELTIGGELFFMLITGPIRQFTFEMSDHGTKLQFKPVMITDDVVIASDAL